MYFIWRHWSLILQTLVSTRYQINFLCGVQKITYYILQRVVGNSACILWIQILEERHLIWKLLDTVFLWTYKNCILFSCLGDENWLADDIPNDSLLRDPSQVPRIQVDFGNIGRLQKVRFEIQPAGDQPNYYLEYVEAQDLDTRERCVLMYDIILLIGIINNKNNNLGWTIGFWRKQRRDIESFSHSGKLPSFRTIIIQLLVRFSILLPKSKMKMCACKKI